MTQFTVSGDLQVLAHMSLPFGSMFPELGDMWKYGCPKGGIATSAFGQEARGFDKDNEEVSEVNTKGLRKVWEGPEKGCGHFWILGMPWKCAQRPTAGTFQARTGHMASSSSSS